MTPTIPPGTTLADGKYRVVRLLGAGGMGAVYEAENTTTHKRVAIKCLRPGREPGEAASARLVREAKASARIRHPNVVDVYDVVRADELVYLVMEYLDGEPLSDLLARGPLSPAAALTLLVPVMRGVAAAHRQGVIHRDLKPANIFLAREEDAPAPVPKLLDFGVSKLGFQEPDSAVLTRSGQIVGTPLYMPLEQLMGDKELDVRADVYALGVVLYEALTGQPPYRAATLPELIVKLTSMAPAPPNALRPEIPPALGDAVLRALARDKAERTPSIAALLQELDPFLGRTEARRSAPEITAAVAAEVDAEGTAPTLRQVAPAAAPLGTHDGAAPGAPRAGKWRLPALFAALAMALAYAGLRLSVAGEADVRGPTREPLPTPTRDVAGASGAPALAPTVAHQPLSPVSAPDARASAAPASTQAGAADAGASRTRRTPRPRTPSKVATPAPDGSPIEAIPTPHLAPAQSASTPVDAPPAVPTRIRIPDSKEF